jgi:hypothetical protein
MFDVFRFRDFWDAVPLKLYAEVTEARENAPFSGDAREKFSHLISSGYVSAARRSLRSNGSASAIGETVKATAAKIITWLKSLI